MSTNITCPCGRSFIIMDENKVAVEPGNLLGSPAPPTPSEQISDLEPPPSGRDCTPDVREDESVEDCVREIVSLVAPWEIEGFGPDYRLSSGDACAAANYLSSLLCAESKSAGRVTGDEIHELIDDVMRDGLGEPAADDKVATFLRSKGIAVEDSETTTQEGK